MRIKNHFLKILVYIVVALVLRYAVIPYALDAQAAWLQTLAILVIFGFGIGLVFIGTADVIEETTDVLKDRTGLAGGFLQSLGTAFPDMIIGIVAALGSLLVSGTDHIRAINLAIIAASATFGSNIYNILYSVWCVHRQNVADERRHSVFMVPYVPSLGKLKPLKDHRIKPTIKEMDGAIRVLMSLTLLTAFVASSMVVFGRVNEASNPLSGDLYQLIRPVGVILFLLCVGILYYFRKSNRAESPLEEVEVEERYYSRQSTARIWFDLLLSGVAILFAAESMVKAMEVFSQLTHIPFVVTGIAAGIIGCLGEMIVIHNFSVHPKGRIGDAIVGVAMDNIVTTLGASVVAIMGGIFLGGNSLILIFVVILTANTLLIEQISKLKNKLV